MSICGLMDEEIAVDVYNGIFSYKEWNLTISSNMVGLQGHCAKCHTEKDKYCMISFMCGI